jgi:RND family efflux transporter MFP subunit
MREAQLRMSRMQIRTPADGVVLSLNAAPGMRISMRPGGDVKEEGIVRLYDPAKLQVRVDVPLADAAKVHLGGDAEVTTEAVPDHVFRGRVVRAVHEADIQRNTVQFKIDLPDAGNVLKPEMLTRVRLISHVQDDAPASETPSASGDVLLAPLAAIQERKTRPFVWVVVPRTRAGVEHVRMAPVSLGGETAAGYVVVEKGLSPGDRLIVEPAEAIQENQAVVVRGERVISQ